MGVSELTDVEAARRPLRTYAYLTACREQLRSEDALDCILPFIIASIRQQRPDFQLDEKAALAFLASIGLNLPPSVFTHLKERLRTRGILKYFNGADIILPPGPAEAAPQADLGTSLDELDRALQQFAINDFNAIVPPVSASWSEALIGVLKSETTIAQLPQGVKAAVHEVAIISDPAAFERLIIGRFIQHAEARRTEDPLYDTVMQVFSGIKIEDFIRDIQMFSLASRSVSLQVYYDTSILLRILGLSGDVLKASVIRMHKSLVKIGCKTKFLPITKAEVATILERIVKNPQDSHPETLEAYRRGELPESLLRDLDLRFARVLYDDFGIAEFSFARTKEIIKWELNANQERQLTGLLEAEGKHYKDYSIRNDVRAVSEMLALRRGEVTEDITEAKHLFISVNPLLQRAAKTFCAQFLSYYGGRKSQSIPPVLLAGQMASLAWLTAEQEVERKEEISQELLVTCFNAVRPSRDWMARFEEVFEEYKNQDPDVVGKLASGVILMRTIRGFAQDASRNQPRQIEGQTLRQAVEASEKQRGEQKAAQAALVAANEKMAMELAALRKALQEREQAQLRADQAAKEREQARLDEERAAAEREREKVAADRLLEEQQNTRRAAERMALEQIENQPPEHAIERDPVAMKFVFLVLVLALIGLNLYFARDAIWLIVGVPVLVAGTPMLFGMVFYGHRFAASHWMTVYGLGMAAIPLIGRAFKPGTEAHTPLPPDPPQKAPRPRRK